MGGPGGSGIGVADDYLSAFDARLTENMDIVFFDQRGVGPDHGLECPKAQGKFDLTDITVAKPDEAIAAARKFATDCPAELKSRDLLGFVDTGAAIRDLEEFRQKIGAPKVWIYGESYGTQFSQQYATLYPTAVKGVVVDGVVDLALEELHRWLVDNPDTFTRVLGERAPWWAPPKLNDAVTALVKALEDSWA